MTSISVIYPKVLGGLLLVLAVIAFIDFMYQHTLTPNRLKCETRAKRRTQTNRRVARGKGKNSADADGKSANSARQTAALDDVASATAVITNPTHLPWRCV